MQPTVTASSSLAAGKYPASYRKHKAYTPVQRNTSPEKSPRSEAGVNTLFATDMQLIWWYAGGMADEVKMSIRLAQDLHERLKRAAALDHRSMHAQMLAYIERCLEQDEGKKGSRSR
jgi:hypothetical protein